MKKFVWFAAVKLIALWSLTANQLQLMLRDNTRVEARLLRCGSS
jgi:hypothetical protein